MTCKWKPRARSVRETPLSAQAIADADVVLLARDIEVATERFAGKRIYRCGTGIALKQSEATLKKALAEGQQESHGFGDRKAPVQEGEDRRLQTPADRRVVHAADGGGGRFDDCAVVRVRHHRVQGRRHAGGGTDADRRRTAFKLMVPLLAGYIAYSIADRPGLAPGMIGGLLASTLGAGFIGGIIAGFIAGYAAKAISRYVAAAGKVSKR